MLDSSLDTAKTAPALLTLALGIPAYIINKIMVSNFFANEETKAPFKIALVCLVVNVIGNLILIRYLEHVGITLTTAFTGWLNTILLVIFSYRKGIFSFDVLKSNAFHSFSSCKVSSVPPSIKSPTLNTNVGSNLFN